MRGMAQPSHSRNIVDLSSKDFTEHSCPVRSPKRSNFPGSRGLTVQPGIAGCAALDGDKAPFSPKSAVHMGSEFQARLHRVPNLAPSKLKASESGAQESEDSPRLAS